MDTFIRQELITKFPSIPIITEEKTTEPLYKRKLWREHWLIDPIDSTQQFIERGVNFSVNIALIKNHAVQIGVIYFPALKTIYFGGKDIGAFKQTEDTKILSINTKKTNLNNIKILSNIDARKNKKTNILINNLKNKIIDLTIARLPGSIKFCDLAEGKADIIPKLDRIYEWDLAASQAIIEGAGGIVVNNKGDTIKFNNNESLLCPKFIAVADSSVKNEILSLIDKSL